MRQVKMGQDQNPPSLTGMEFKLALIRKQSLKNDIREGRVNKHKQRR
jgi:hypothetical protein